MSGHTPGPWWHYPPRPFKRGIEVHRVRAEGVRGDLVATVVRREDAPLIAAAPDMLDSFKALLADFKAIKQHLDGGPWAFADTAIKGHEAFIAKVEGKKPDDN